MKHRIGAFTLCCSLVACGGQSSSDDDTSGAGGSGGTTGTAGAGASQAGGGAGTDGSAGVGGASLGGSGGSGAVVTVGGAAGSGGNVSSGGSGGTPSVPLPDCLQPIEVGTCRGVFPAYGFDPATGSCQFFTYGGCGGNGNRFDSLEECHAACVADLPMGCDAPTNRPLGCPCTAEDQCICSAYAYEVHMVCEPSPVGVCRPGIGEGSCMCRPATGELVCGV